MKSFWVAGVLIFLVAPSPCAIPDRAGRYGDLPLYFIENQGQVDSTVRYYVHGRDKSVYFAPDGVTFALSRAAAGDAGTRAPRRWAVKLDFIDTNPAAAPVGGPPAPAIVSYFHGPVRQWKTALPTYAGVTYNDLWPGVDLLYTGTTDRLKYQFVVNPGADPGRIRLRYRGAESVRLDGTGRLEVSTPLGSFSDEPPRAWQEVNGVNKEIPVRFQLAPSNSFHFELGDYDPRLPLIIDPAVVISVSYIGGVGNDVGNAIAVDAAGNAYITGRAYTSDAFPLKAGPDLTINGANDAFVLKLNPLGTALLYAGFIGGSGTDIGHGIAVDQEGNAYVAGNTWSSEETFPATVGPDLTHNGENDAFVAKVNPSGTALVFAGYVGGATWDRAEAIALDSDGNVYLTGSTDSTEATFPVKVGPDPTANGDRDAFIAKVRADGTGLVYAGYIGGAAWDIGYGVAVDAGGNAYVTGQALSTEATFPVKVGPDLTLADPDGDAFIAKVDAGGAGLTYCGYIGGAAADIGNGIAVDASGSAYVAGRTLSAEDTFPVLVGPDVTHNAESDGFIAKVNSGGTALEYAGYIGGSRDDAATDVAVGGGAVYVTGWTMSDPASFPLTNGPDAVYAGGTEAFLARVTRDGSGLDYSGYIGGSGDDFAYGIAVDDFGSAYITGSTNSPAETFSAPVSFGELKGTDETTDVFVARIAEGPVVAGVFNAASWLPAGLPGHGIAQGAMFVLTGRNMGPDPLVFPGTLPLPTLMSGTSIEVTVGGVTVDAFMVYTWTNQLAAVLPSGTPVGQGTLTVIYNGEASAPFPILVVSSAFGIFTRNQSGYGPAIVQNWYSPADIRLNSLIDSAVEDQYEILWGSGLGAIAGDDSNRPPVGDLDVDVQVLVDGIPAALNYKGRSAEFPGIDQIQFQVPAGVVGCYVPVAIVVNGTVSNFGTMSINTAGGACSDSVSFTAADLGPAAQGANTRMGAIVLLGVDLSAPGMPDGGGLTSASAEFGSIPQASLLQGLGPVGFGPSFCLSPWAPATSIKASGRMLRSMTVPPSFRCPPARR